MHVHRSRSRLAGAMVAAAAAAMVTFGSAGTAEASTASQYVALGDSYTSGPLILPISTTAPLDCLQSAVDYPHRVAAADGLSLSDESCSGATTSDMTTAQHGDQPPQFDALGSATKVVTIGIGGNDNGLFLDALLTCVGLDALDLFNIGSPCKSIEGSSFDNDIASDAPGLGTAFARIHTLAPNAKVLVVGYPDILPQSSNCNSNITLTTGDVAYLGGVEKTLDATLQKEATANGASFVNTFAPSIGHDVCQPESNRWVEPPVPSTDAAPAHPNSKGEAADARDVEGALAADGIS